MDLKRAIDKAVAGVNPYILIYDKKISALKETDVLKKR
jgi:chaperonin GroEL (HSP60 family)